tara:strand:- start:52160 stop:53512 length:1353 start_codon:yes stop_codon:yes gene_type:complete
MDNNTLQIKFKQRLNKIASNDYDNIECWQIVEAFNKAQIEWCRRQLRGTNMYKDGDEMSKRRVDDLEILLKEVDLIGDDVNYDSTFGYFQSSNFQNIYTGDYLEYKRIKASAIQCDPGAPGIPAQPGTPDGPPTEIPIFEEVESTISVHWPIVRTKNGITIMTGNPCNYVEFSAYYSSGPGEWTFDFPEAFVTTSGTIITDPEVLATLPPEGDYMQTSSCPTDGDPAMPSSIWQEGGDCWPIDNGDGTFTQNFPDCLDGYNTNFLECDGLCFIVPDFGSNYTSFLTTIDTGEVEVIPGEPGTPGTPAVPAVPCTCAPNVEKEKGCQDPRSMTVYLSEVGNVDVILRDPLKNPDFDWGETFVTFKEKELRIWRSDFWIRGPELIYYRKPVNIQIIDCVDPYTGSQSTVDVPCEFKDDIVELIIDEAVSIIAGDIGDINNFSRGSQSAEKNN